MTLTGRTPHVVTLVSIEDDARDERLRVVWELERGAVAHDQHALPSPADGFDDPGQLDAFLDAVRWGAARTMLIVCPAGLTLQWHDEMRDKFGLAFRIVDAELLRDLRRSRGLYANPWTHYPRRSGPWRRTASTACSCPRPRTTGT